MRAYVLTALLVVFASCETQELELVPAEVKADDEGSGGSGGRREPDAGDGQPSTGGTGGGEDDTGGVQGAGGGPPSGSGGDVGGLGGKGNGARPGSGDGGASGAGGGPSFSGGFSGLGGAPNPLDCRRTPCRSGYCAPNGNCVQCLEKSHCNKDQTCDPELFRCLPFCDSPDDCSGAASVCHEIRHTCVECAAPADCTAKYRTRGVCLPIVSVCVGCTNHGDCGGDFCVAGRCACADDSGCEENERCNDQHQCVLKLN